MVNFGSIANDPDNADKLNNDDNDYDDGKDENDDYEELCGNGGGVGNNWSDDGCQDIIDNNNDDYHVNDNSELLTMLLVLFRTYSMVELELILMILMVMTITNPIVRLELFVSFMMIKLIMLM